MKILCLKTVRDVRALGIRAVALVLIIASGLGVHAGMRWAGASVIHTRDGLYERLKLADLSVQIVPATTEELPSLAGIPGVAAVSRRYLSGNYVTLPDGTTAAALLVAIEEEGRPAVNDIGVTEGRFVTVTDGHEVMIDHNFASAHHLHAGDQVQVETVGSPRSLSIVGIGVSPEFLVATPNPTMLVPAKGSLAILFLSMARMVEDFGYPLYNDLEFRFAPEADAEATRERIVARLAGLEITRIRTRERGFTYRFVEEGLKMFAIFTPAAVCVLLLVVFVAAALSFDRLVKAQRHELGVLGALGYGPRQLATPILLLGLILVALAIVPGIGGALFVRNLVASRHGAAIGMPPIEYVAPLTEFLTAASLAAVVVSVAGLRPAWLIARLSPHEAMRPPMRRRYVGPPAMLRRMEARLQGSPGVRYATREVARRPWLAAATGIAIAIAAGGAIASRASSTSVSGLASLTLDRERWDVAVDFRVPIEAKELLPIAATAGLRHVEPILRGFAAVEFPDGAADYVVTGLPPDVSLRRLLPVAGRGAFSGPDAPEVILSRGLHSAQGVAVGDRIRVSAGGREMPLLVVGLLNDLSLDEINVPLRVAQTLLGKPGQVSGILAVSEGPIGSLRSALFSHQSVAQVSSMSDLIASAEDFLSGIRSITDVASWIQVAIAVLVLFATQYMTFLERRGEYSVLQAIGYRNRDITAMVLIEAVGVGTPALAAAVPIGVVFATFLNAALSRAWVDVPLIVSMSDIGSVLLPGLVCLPLAAMPAVRNLLRTDLPTLLRTKAFG